MSSLRVVLRQILAERWTVFVVAAVLFVSALAGAVAPGWIASKLDAAVNHVVAESEADLTGHGRLETSLDHMNWVADDVMAREPLVDRAFGDARWRVATDDGSRVGRGGHNVSIVMPSDLAAQVRVVDGDMPSAKVTGGGPDAATVVEAVVTTELADEVGIAVGDEFNVAGLFLDSYDPAAPPPSPEAHIVITGLVEPVDPEWPGWRELSRARHAAVGFDDVFYSVLAAPEAIQPLSIASSSVMNTDWTFPIASRTNLTAGEATDLVQAVRRTETAGQWFTNLDAALDDHLASRASAERVTALGAASLAALVVVLIALSLRLLAERRANALRLARTRGASYLTLTRQLATEGLLIAAVAVGGGAIAGLTLTNDPPTATSLIAPALIALTAIAGLPVVGCWLARSAAAQRPEQESLRPSPRRLVAEGGTLLLAIAALWLLSTRSASGSTADPLVSLTPVLAAFAAGLVVFRILPYVVVSLIGWTRRGRGAAPFLAATRAGRTGSSAVLPIIAITIAVGLAALGGAVGSTAEQGRELTSWTRVPADVIVATSTLHVPKDEIADLVPDADAVAVAQEVSTQEVTIDAAETVAGDVLAVDVGAWEKVTAGAPEPVEMVQLLKPRDDRHVPMVVAGDGVAEVGDAITITTRSGDRITTKVAGVVPPIPGSGGGSGDSLFIPDAALADVAAEVEPSVVFLAGDVDIAAASDALKASAIQTRSEALTATDEDPLLSATTELFAIALVSSASLAGVAAVLSLLVTSRSRAFALSVLRTLGISNRQSTGLVIAEVVPAAVLAAAVGVGIGSAVTLVAEGALDLSALTSTLDADRPVVLDFGSTSLTAVGVVAVVMLAVGITVVISNRANLGSAMRVGDSRE